VPSDYDVLLTRLLEALDEAPAASMLDVSYEVLAEPLKLRHLWLYVSDYSEETLRPVPTLSAPPPPRDAIHIMGTIPGRVYLTREPIEQDNEHGAVLWMPVFRRTEAIGVLSLGVHSVDTATRDLAPALALAIGGAVVGARRHSDIFELARGARHLRLAAAMQWDLLPLPTYMDPRVEIAGRVEPAYDIGGDAFDFAANDDRLEIAVFDAMGHGLRATLLTTLAVGAYRFARRRQSSLAGVAQDIDEAVLNHVSGEAFVTGHLCRLDTDTGTLEWLNAGHPLPLLIRNHAASTLAEPEPMLPLGLEGEPTSEVSVQLQPDDIVLFYSDGVIEAREPRGSEYGMARFMDMAGRHGDTETDLLVLVRQILDSVKEHAGGRLHDDATLVAVRWTGRPFPAS
jgi:hypothetical protein